MAAAMAMLDDSHTLLPQPRSDHNSYHLGEIGDHNVVIACLPMQILLTFPSIEVGLMVGIGGGAPRDGIDIRLGDVVVSTPADWFPGVVQYDQGKTMAEGSFYRTGTLNKPPEALLTAGMFHCHGASEDVLFESSYIHRSGSSCDDCDRSREIIRPPRNTTSPCIYYGLIASANQVMKDAGTRDRLAAEMGILCYEMEAAGLMDRFPCLVIRGICDYSDSHKNKQWQDYAAATAAAYARELLAFSSTPRTISTSVSCAPRIRHGADPSQGDGKGRTALHLAVVAKDVYLVRLLLERVPCRCDGFLESNSIAPSYTIRSCLTLSRPGSSAW
ncbi:nucleoside phosphorylase domain-containing protein [Aspergillus foveolatus]|uniref:nucleoside phosphorylase domain-containing protein n=1 Tax=Aspergillus foveolatus TaxID=210207 RepID=UPI003CCCC42C